MDRRARRYDPEGNRIQSTYDGSTTTYIFDLTGLVTENPIFEQDSTGGRRNYIYLNRRLLARVDNIIDTGEKHWYLTDHLGSARGLTDQNGTLVWWADYEAFGKVKATGGDGSITEVPRFTDKAWDEYVGLYYFNARWYDAGLGRFVEEDPVGEGLNWHSYCQNEPLSHIDPAGKSIVCVCSVSWGYMTPKQLTNSVRAYARSTNNKVPEVAFTAVGLAAFVVKGAAMAATSAATTLLSAAMLATEQAVSNFFAKLDSALQASEGGETVVFIKKDTTTISTTPDHSGPGLPEAQVINVYTAIVVDKEGNVVDTFSVSRTEELLDPNITPLIPYTPVRVISDGTPTQLSEEPTLSQAIAKHAKVAK